MTLLATGPRTPKAISGFTRGTCGPNRYGSSGCFRSFSLEVTDANRGDAFVVGNRARCALSCMRTHLLVGERRRRPITAAASATPCGIEDAVVDAPHHLAPARSATSRLPSTLQPVLREQHDKVRYEVRKPEALTFRTVPEMGAAQLAWSCRQGLPSARAIRRMPSNSPPSRACHAS